jgi:glycosyltransferase involved in cell wall biosynthesis
MQSTALVTVVGLCYNHSRYVIETLESIRNQQYKNLQVILIDDCSKDNSVAIVEEWLQQHQLNWTFIKHTQNKGVTKSLNESLELAKGKYYKAVACDDALEPQFISYMVERFETLEEDVALIYSDVLTMDEHSVVFGQSPFAERGWLTDEQVPSGKLFDKLAGWCFIPAVGTFMRTSVLQEIRFDEKLMIEDWDMWLQIARRYQMKGAAVAMAKYRIHSASMYQVKSPSYQDAELRVVKKHMGYSAVADQQIKEFIYKKSISLYMHGGLRPLYWLWQRFLIKKSIKNSLHVGIALLGMNYEEKAKWKKRVKRALLMS